MSHKFNIFVSNRGPWKKIAIFEIQQNSFLIINPMKYDLFVAAFAML